MRELAERSVDGTVDVEYAPYGVSWRLTCTAANALQAAPANSWARGKSTGSATGEVRCETPT
jgi:hypothetical protein